MDKKEKKDPFSNRKIVYGSKDWRQRIDKKIEIYKKNREKVRSSQDKMYLDSLIAIAKNDKKEAEAAEDLNSH